MLLRSRPSRERKERGGALSFLTLAEEKVQTDNGRVAGRNDKRNNNNTNNNNESARALQIQTSDLS